MAARSVIMTSLLITCLTLAACGTFRNVSTVTDQLVVDGQSATHTNGAAAKTPFRVVQIHDDGQVELATDNAGTVVTLTPGKWADLPVPEGMVSYRVRLVDTDPATNKVTIDREVDVESGPPILRHL